MPQTIDSLCASKGGTMSQRNDALKFIVQDARNGLLRTLAQVGEDQWTKPSGVEGWTVKDVVTHLAYNQPSQPHLIRNILSGKGGAPANFDLNYYNKRGLEKMQGKSLEELQALLAAGHADALKLIDELGDEQLDAKGQHPSAGFVTVAEILHMIAYHDMQHTRHIAEALNR
jgi:uncharacterized protein (TIGR03083 family)